MKTFANPKHHGKVDFTDFAKRSPERTQAKAATLARAQARAVAPRNQQIPRN